MRTVLAIVALALVVGVSTAVAFYLVGGPLALRGTYVLAREWPLIYAVEALMVGAVGFLVGTASTWRPPPRTIALVIVAAWIGEYIVVASGLLANELAFWYSPLNGVAVWIAATAGPLQPIAVLVGVAVGRRLTRRSS